jgi:hypothetical protein
VRKVKLKQTTSQAILNKMKELRQKRSKWVDANRENGFEDGIKNLLTQLYPDNAHFIYELLQNAEDTEAKNVRFTLSGSAVEFEHDGKRNFSFSDVESITSIANSNKRDEPTKIGKFGVGFKAVFAYTDAPEIHSGDFHFRINDLVIPETEGISQPPMGSQQTRFIFPFTDSKKRDKAVGEVERGLSALGNNTLLFLSHICKIEYLLPDGSSSTIERIEHQNGHIEITASQPGKENTSTHWQIFNKDVEVIDEDKKTKSCRIAIAYSLAKEDGKYKRAKWKIVPLDHGQVSIYFPAEKETSNLRFHIHAPFASTVARDSVRDCQANNDLRDHLKDLIVESLVTIRDKKMLDVSFLAVLPNPLDNLPDFYEPIRQAIVEEMNEQALTPTYTKTHAPAKYLYQAKASLKGLLSNDDIKFLVDLNDEPLQWASARAMQGTNTERFMTGLAITKWDIDEFLKLLEDKLSVNPRWNHDYSSRITKPDEDCIAWLAEKSLPWHQQLYALLYTDCLQNAGSINFTNLIKLLYLKIVRLSNGDYGQGEDCYFPSADVEQDDGLKRVHAETYTTGTNQSEQAHAKKFLEEIGVREIGEAEQVEAILKQRYMQTNHNPQKKDLKRFVALLEKEPDKKSLFTSYHIFECTNGVWRKPVAIYLDQPFMATGLSAYYNAVEEKASGWALAESYQTCGINKKKLAEFAAAVGAKTKLEVLETTCDNNPDAKFLYSVPGKKTNNSVDRDYEIPYLEHILEQPCLAISKLIWECMQTLPRYPDPLKAICQNNRTKGPIESDSTFVHQLRAAAWVPQGDENFVRPAEALSSLLPKGFAFDSGWPWINAINFGEEARKRSQEHKVKESSAEVLGFQSADTAAKWAEIDKLGISPDDILSENRKSNLPDKVSNNPEKRSKKIVGEALSAPTKTQELRARTIDPDYRDAQGEARTYLKHQYTNDDGVMFCQLCRDEQPVLLDGVPHYEAVTCLGGIDAHLNHNNLALCPNHAAMYKNSKLIPDVIRCAILETENQEIELNLAGNEVKLYFTQQHLDDLRAVLSALDFNIKQGTDHN